VRASGNSGPWVLKLGGSLAASSHLSDWLRTIDDGGGGRLVLVAGGGPFADAVRAAQAGQGFDDTVAHRMALLAMEQYAWMLAGLRRRLSPVASRDEMLAASNAGAVPVWLPSRMVLARSDIAASWEVTSDSLSAWLARDLKASLLILVKAVALRQPGTAAALARDGIVDRAFPAYLARCGCECSILGAAEHRALAAALRDGVAPGTRVLPAEG
jgi:dihydroneopterin aldolase